jgi:hypothetical protein
MRVMYGAERAKAVNTTFCTSIALDHKLYARASLNFRGRQRYDAVAYGNYEGENQHDLGKLVVRVRMHASSERLVKETTTATWHISPVWLYKPTSPNCLATCTASHLTPALSCIPRELRADSSARARAEFARSNGVRAESKFARTPRGFARTCPRGVRAGLLLRAESARTRANSRGLRADIYSGCVKVRKK